MAVLPAGLSGPLLPPTSRARIPGSLAVGSRQPQAARLRGSGARGAHLDVAGQPARLVGGVLEHAVVGKHLGRQVACTAPGQRHRSWPACSAWAAPRAVAAVQRLPTTPGPPTQLEGACACRPPWGGPQPWRGSPVTKYCPSRRLRARISCNRQRQEGRSPRCAAQPNERCRGAAAASPGPVAQAGWHGRHPAPCSACCCAR